MLSNNEEFRSLIMKYDLSVKACAKLLGVSQNSIKRYLSKPNNRNFLIASDEILFLLKMRMASKVFASILLDSNKLNASFDYLKRNGGIKIHYEYDAQNRTCTFYLGESEQ